MVPGNGKHVTHLPVPAGRRAPGKTGGFTLIELMTVIVIIGLLISILVPSIRTVLGTTEGAKSLARIQDLASGCHQYRIINSCWPGQNTSTISTGVMPLPGSQYLALCLFTFTPPPVTNFTNPGSGLVNYSTDMLADPNTTGGLQIPRGTILDAFNKPLAVLYYVSIPGSTGSNQYTIRQNAVYTPTSKTDADLATFVQDARIPGSAKPFNDQEFILIAPGPDRQYLTDDDLANFPRK
jgi:prepilin-type N-terminal cleavage/methylation domain-containing protein